MVFSYVIAGGKSRNLVLVQISVGVVLNILHTGAGFGETGLFNQSFQMIAFSGAPFFIHGQTKAVFKGHDIQLYEQDNEPSVSMAVEWFPGSIKAEMLITSKGIRYMKLDGALSFDGQPTSKKIISVDEAMDKLKDKYSQVILTEPYTVTKIYLEYLTIPEKDKKPLEAMQTLRPYWCFIIQVLEDDNGQIFEKAERFNAFTGADLSYGG